MKFTKQVVFYTLEMIVAGSASSLLIKGQQELSLAPGPSDAPVAFNHPYMTTFFMFVGEAACLAAFVILRLFNKRSDYLHIEQLEIGPAVDYEVAEKEAKRGFKAVDVFKFLVPTLCDLVASTLYNIGIYYADVSVYQMLRNMAVCFVALFSAICFRDYRKGFDVPQIIGLVFLLGGSVLISYSSTVLQGEETTARNQVLGIFIILVGTIVNGMFSVSEEIFLRKIEIHPLAGVGIEGCWGLLIHIPLLPVYNYCPCPWDENKAVFEDIEAWAYQVRESWILIVTIICYIGVTFAFNHAGMELTNRVAAAYRITFEGLRTILIYFCSLMFGWERWQTLSSSLQMIGFVIVMVGVLTYNNILVYIPFARKDNALKHGGKMCCGKKAIRTYYNYNEELEDM